MVFVPADPQQKSTFPLHLSIAAACSEQLPDLFSICRLECHCTASCPSKGFSTTGTTVLVAALSSLHCSSGDILLLMILLVSFAGCLVQHPDWELSSRFGGLFFTSEPMAKLQAHSTMERIKSCFLSFFTKNLFIYGWPWMDTYFQNSGKLPSVYCIFTDF